MIIIQAAFAGNSRFLQPFFEHPFHTQSRHGKSGGRAVLVLFYRIHKMASPAIISFCAYAPWILPPQSEPARPSMPGRALCRRAPPTVCVGWFTGHIPRSAARSPPGCLPHLLYSSNSVSFPDILPLKIEPELVHVPNSLPNLTTRD